MRRPEWLLQPGALPHVRPIRVDLGARLATRGCECSERQDGAQSHACGEQRLPVVADLDRGGGDDSGERRGIDREVRAVEAAMTMATAATVVTAKG